MANKEVHCWTDGPLTEDGCSTTCMLKDGHDGPHVWTRDDQIVVRISAEMRELIERFNAERKLLAMLAAKKPQFDNPLHAMHAESIRDEILAKKR